jgi:hypothetical protein
MLTIVSVTKGIGRAAFGGRGGVPLWVGGKGGAVDMHCLGERKTLRCSRERPSRRTERDMGSIGMLSRGCAQWPSPFNVALEARVMLTLPNGDDLR